jgi:hypothetical protein
MEGGYYLYLPDKAMFDVDLLTEQMSSDPAIVRDPYDSDIVFWVCEDGSGADYIRARLAVGHPPVRGFITLRPDYIVVGYQYASRDALDKMAKIIIPLITKLHCRIGNEHGDDMTSCYEGQLGRLFDSSIGEERPIKRPVLDTVYIDGEGIEWTDNIVKVNLKAAANTDAAARLISVFGPKVGTSELVSFAIDQPSDPKHWKDMEETRKAFGVVEACNRDSEFVTVTIAARGDLSISPPRPIRAK